MGAGAVHLPRQQELAHGLLAAASQYCACLGPAAGVLEHRGASEIHAACGSDPVTTSRPLLSAAISAGYPGNVNVLNGFELVINEGEIVGLVGESGSGKST